MDIARATAGFLSILFLALPLHAADVSIAYSEPVTLIASADAGDIQKLTQPSLRFDALGRRFDLTLTSNDRLFDPSTRARLGVAATAYRGALAGLPGSWARIVLLDGVPQGVIWDGRELYALEPAPDEPRQAIIFRLADLLIAPGSLSCSELGGVESGEQLLQTLTRKAAPEIAEAVGARSEINVAIVSDFEFFERSGGNPAAALVTRMNIVDGIFSEQLGVQLNISVLDDFDTASDPFTDTGDASALLGEVSAYRRNNAAHSAAGLTHLFTGRDLDGTTAGVAYIGALCSQRFGVALTQATRTVTTDSLIAAHEFGHNFGAEHDGEEGSDCASTPRTFLMAPSVTNNDQFSQCSLVAMELQVANAQCISALSSTDVAVSASGQAQSVLMGEAGSVVFEVSNVGAVAANNVVLDATLDPGATLSGASAVDGNCTTGAGAARCTFDSLPTGSARNVTLSATQDVPGTVVFTAVVSVADDARDTNNEASAALRFDPVTDLRVVAGNASVPLDSAVDVVAEIDNLGTQGANSVVVTVTPGDGLQIDSAQWSRGPCIVDSNVAECLPATLAAGVTDELQLRFTGVSAGDRSYTLAAVSDTADSNVANNTAIGRINVTSNAPVPAPAAGGDSGGGGAFGGAGLLLLSGVLYVRRRRGAG